MQPLYTNVLLLKTLKYSKYIPVWGRIKIANDPGWGEIPALARDLGRVAAGPERVRLPEREMALEEELVVVLVEGVAKLMILPPRFSYLPEE